MCEKGDVIHKRENQNILLLSVLKSISKIIEKDNHVISFTTACLITRLGVKTKQPNYLDGNISMDLTLLADGLAVTENNYLVSTFPSHN